MKLRKPGFFIVIIFILLLQYSCNGSLNFDSVFNRKKKQEVVSPSVELVNENQRLHKELSSLKKDQKEEQQAIIEFMVLFDSINSSVASMQGSLINIEYEQEISNYDQRRQLLRNLDRIEQKIEGDKLRIEYLQNRLNKLSNNRTEQALITTLRNQIEIKDRQISELNKDLNRISSKLVEAVEVIDQQEEIIDEQQDAISEQKDIISQHIAELNKRYILLISKKDMQIYPFPDQNIYLKYRKGRIRILNDDGRFCSISRSNDNGSLVNVHDRFWDENKYLIIYVSRSL